MRKEDENSEKCVITGVVEGTCGRGRPQRAWSDDFQEWTKLSTEETMQLTKDRADEGVWSIVSSRQYSHQRIRHQRRRVLQHINLQVCIYERISLNQQIKL